MVQRILYCCTQMDCLTHPLGCMHLALETTSLGYGLEKGFNLMETGVKSTCS